MPYGIIYQHGQIIREKINYSERVVAKTQF